MSIQGYIARCDSYDRLWVTALFVSLALASTVLCFPDLYDHTRSSFWLSVSYVVSIFAMLMLFRSSRRVQSVRFNWFDVIFTCWILSDLFYFPGQLHMLAVTGKLALAGLYMILRRITGANDSIPYLLGISLSILSVCLYAYLQYFGFLSSHRQYFTVTGPFANPAMAAGLLTFLWVSVFGFLLFGHFGRRGNYLLLAVILLSLPVLAMLNSRASWVALTVGIGYLLSCRYRRQLKFGKRNALILAGALVTALVIGLYGLYHIRTASADGRLLIWKISTEMIKDRPFFGHGTDGFKSQYMHYQAAYFAQGGTEQERQLSGNVSLTYSEPLRIWVSYGLLGLLGYLATAYFILFIFHPRDFSGQVLKASILAFFTLGLFSYPQQNYALLTWGTVAWAYCGSSAQQRLFSIKSGMSARYGLLSLLLFMPVAVAGLIWQHSRYHRLRLVWSTPAVSAIRPHEDFLKKHLVYFKADRGFLPLYARYLYLSERYPETISILLTWEQIQPSSDLYMLWGDCLRDMGNLGDAEDKYRYADQMAPSRQAARGRLALLYRQQGCTEEALLLARQILSEPVKVYGFDTYELHQKLRTTFGIH